MDQDMSIGPDDEDDLSDLLRDAACDWDLFGFGSGKTGDSPDEILINIKKNGKEETFRSNYSDGEMSYEFTATGDARATPYMIRKLCEDYSDHSRLKCLARTRGRSMNLKTTTPLWWYSHGFVQVVTNSARASIMCMSCLNRGLSS